MKHVITQRCSSWSLANNASSGWDYMIGIQYWLTDIWYFMPWISCHDQNTHRMSCVSQQQISLLDIEHTWSKHLPLKLAGWAWSHTGSFTAVWLTTWFSSQPSFFTRITLESEQDDRKHHKGQNIMKVIVSEIHGKYLLLWSVEFWWWPEITDGRSGTGYLSSCMALLFVGIFRGRGLKNNQDQWSADVWAHCY